MRGGLDQGSWQLIQPGGKHTVLDPSPGSRERGGRKGKVASAGDDVQGLGRKNGGFWMQRLRIAGGNNGQELGEV